MLKCGKDSAAVLARIIAGTMTVHSCTGPQLLNLHAVHTPCLTDCCCRICMAGMRHEHASKAQHTALLMEVLLLVR